MRRGLAVLVFFVLFLSFGLAPPAGAADLSGSAKCSGQAQSSDSNGRPLDSVAAPGPGGTHDDPFLVDYNGVVRYSGHSGEVITNHSWHLQIFFIPIRSGGSDNSGGDTRTDGTERPADDLPFRFAGLYYVSGGISGTGGSCDGSAWIKLVGSPVGTVPWIVSLALIVLGLILLFLALPTWKAARAAAAPPAGPIEGREAAVRPVAAPRKKHHVILGVLGGFLLGLGLSLLLAAYSQVWFGKLTLLIFLVALILLGLLLALFGPARRREPAPAV